MPKGIDFQSAFSSGFEFFLISTFVLIVCDLEFSLWENKTVTISICHYQRQNF
jgi:hypothetical protein